MTDTTGPPPAGDGPLPALTARELEVLIRCAHGSTYGQIASTMCLTEKSVSNIARRVLAKMPANNITHAVYLACKWGLIPTNPPTLQPGETNTQRFLRLIHSLIAAGWTVSGIAAHMNTKQTELSQMMRRRRHTPRTLHALEQAFLDLYDVDPLAAGLHRRGVTRARNLGAAMGWEIVPAAEVQRMRTQLVDAA